MDLSLMLDLVTVVALILGILFGLVQLRHYHLSRQRDAALYLLNSFQTMTFLQGIMLIMGEVPDGLSKQELEEKLAEDVSLLLLVMRTWDRVGLLLFNRKVTLAMIEQAHGAQILLSWKKLKTYVLNMRQELGCDTSFEWFQWLAERLAEHEHSNPPTPAYIAHRNWKGTVSK